MSLNAESAVGHLRDAAIQILGPLLMLFLGLVGAGVMAHQAQVGGLWAICLYVPNPERLWAVGRGSRAGARGDAAHGSWGRRASLWLSPSGPFLVN